MVCEFIAIAGFLIGLIYVHKGASKYLLVQKINNTPTSKANSAAVGLVELRGKAKCQISMASPIWGEKCVYWRINAQYYKYGGKGRSGWLNIYGKRSTPQFYLEDETGSILVDPSQATLEEMEVKVVNTYEGYISGKGVFGVQHTQMDGKVLKFIETLDDAGKFAFMDHRDHNVRVFEYYIAEGDDIYVLGSAEPLEGLDGQGGLVVRKGKSDRVMCISNSPEREIVSKMRWGTWLDIIGGTLLSGACFLLLVAILMGVLGVQ